METTNGTGVVEETVKEKRLRRRREARVESHRQRQNNNSLLIEFQPDAVEIEKRSVPGGARWTLYIVIGLICAFVAWSSWAEVDRIVTAEGELITTESTVVIDTKLTSPISSINAKFGDKVSAGFVIATLDPTFSDAELSQLRAQQQALVSTIARLKAERDGVDFDITGHEEERDWLMQFILFNERKKEYAAELNKFNAQGSSFDVQLANVKTEITMNREFHTKFVDYEKVIAKLVDSGSRPKSDMLNRELQSGDALMKVVAAESKEKELGKSLEALKAEREAFVASWRTKIVAELVKSNDEFTRIEQEIKKALRSNDFVELIVPDDLPYKEFVVFEVAEKSVGSTMQPGEPLFKLVPVGVPMEVEVEIPGKDIARIDVATEAQMASGELPKGSDARVKLHSFPYQKHGTLDGVVRAISEGSFEKELPGGGTSGITTYKARIKLPNPDALENVPDNFRLMPGMASTVEIKVGRRKVIEYFLYPLMRYMDESIREP